MDFLKTLNETQSNWFYFGIYIIGYILFSIGFYIYYAYLFGKDTYKNKKLIAYEAIKNGIFSWVGICIFCIGALAVGIIGGLDSLDGWIKDKLKD